MRAADAPSAIYNQIHPLRWRQSRPFSRQLNSQLSNANIGRGMTQTAMEVGQQIIMKEYNPSILKLPREQRPERPLDILKNELAIAEKVCGFWDGNRNALAADRDLVTLLEQTDTGSLPMGAMQWPFPLFYVALPSGLDLWLDEHSEIDGAYVDARHLAHDHISFLITSRRTDIQETASRWPRSAEKVFPIFVSDFDRSLTLAEFMRTYVEERVAELLANANRDRGPLPENVISVAPINEAKRADVIEEQAPSAQRAMALILNIISYLSAEPKTEAFYTQPIPQKLLDDLARGTSARKRRAQSEITRLGILPISLVGRGILSDAERHALSDRSMPVHWRRGHIRMTPFGPGREQTRPKWIRPVLVNKDKGSPEKVHIHPIQAA